MLVENQQDVFNFEILLLLFAFDKKVTSDLLFMQIRVPF